MKGWQDKVIEDIIVNGAVVTVREKELQDRIETLEAALKGVMVYAKAFYSHSTTGQYKQDQALAAAEKALAK